MCCTLEYLRTQDLCKVQRVAVFAISRATEEFVARFTEMIYHEAARNGRVTIQQKDLGMHLIPGSRALH